MTATQGDTIAELQRTVAELRQQLGERDAALAQRKTDFDERIEHQVATIDVLKVMSASPGDAQPVFDLIVDRARDLCDAYGATVFEFDGTGIHWRAATGVSDDPAVRAAYEAQFPMVPTRGWAFGRAILDRRIIRIDDMEAEPGLDPTLRGITAKSNVTIPIMRGDEVIGAIGMGSREKGGFSDSQVELLKTFAEQAVIAITSAETYRALQTRTSDLQETLEYQTATSDVLKVISSSNFALEPVFQTVVETAARLCRADHAVIFRLQDDAFRWAAGTDMLPEFERRMRTSVVRPGTGSLIGRVALQGRPVQILDRWTDPLSSPGAKDSARIGGVRSALGVPLVRDGVTIGAMGLNRLRVEPFTERQIELVSTFADQAVIAIENTRLITEQQEALEQQTATAEVLQVINASPGDLAPVFEAMVGRAATLCEADEAAVRTFDGSVLNLVATHGPADISEELKRLGPSHPDGLYEAIAQGASVTHFVDVRETEAFQTNPRARERLELRGIRSWLAVALRKEGALLGVINVHRREVRPFTDKQIALLHNFAAQAVIAIENARLLRELQEALDEQTATAEVLRVINASPGNLAPVFTAMMDKAARLTQSEFGVLATYDGSVFHAFSGEQSAPETLNPEPGSALGDVVDGAPFIHIADVMDTDAYRARVPSRVRLVEGFGARTCLWIPMRKDDALLGVLASYRREVRPFSDRQIHLLQNFAAQAVIAMENARLITEQREALEQQTATAEVLQVINASPGNLTPVFDAMLEKALRLCGAAFGMLGTYDGVRFEWVTPPSVAGLVIVPEPGSALDRVAKGEHFVHIKDLVDTDAYRNRIPSRVGLVERSGARAGLWVGLHKDNTVRGVILIYRREPRAFTDKQVSLLQNFAAQAVIAMENARLLNEIRQRQEELRVTFEHMGDGVAMFDETQHLVAWNRKFQDILDVPDDIMARRQTFSEYVRYLAERGEYGPEADPGEHVRRLIEQAGQSRTYERTRPDGRVIEIRSNPVAGGGFVLIYADITERKRNEAELRAARDAAEEASRTIEVAYRELKTAQANLIQAEKMASLGQLTAGIAHEIKNPLNFVNNFAELSVDLLGELKDAIAPAEPALTEKQRAEIEEVSVMLTSNLEKITEHGKRADGIVKAMLEHSRGSSGERRMVDLNTLAEEALNLAYHGARAQDQSFNITLERDFGQSIAPIEVNPQDITRVFLNIFANGFYATTKRARDGGDAGFVPTLKVTTRDAGEAVEIRVRDNGTGIPADIRDKLFQPFFTTKPTGEGTGLGLSITYDIVTQQHGGSIAVDSEVGDYSEFTIRLPRKP